MDPKTQNPDPVAKLRDQLTALKSEQAQIANSALARGDGLTADENKRLKEIETETSRMADDLERLHNALAAQEDLAKPQPRKVEPGTVSASAASPSGASSSTRPEYHPIYGNDLAATSPTQGFASPVDFFKAIRNSAASPGSTDRRLVAAKAAATTFANEGSGPEGGWAMPTQYAQNIVKAVLGDGSLAGRMNPMQSASSVYQIPVDETTDWGSTGIQAAKTAEGGSATVSNLALVNRTVTLYKATAMVNVSEELAIDNPAVVQHITRSMAGRLNAILNKWIVNGSGAGEPWGILKAPALVSVDKDSGQTASTITKGNLSKMAGRCLDADQGAFWLASPSAVIGLEDVLLGAGGNTGADFQRGFGPPILGFPVVRSVEAAAIGTAGDCTLVAPSGFISLVKGSVQSDATIFFYFDQGLTTLRAYVRYGQVPVLSSAVVPRVDTATTLSHCVTTAVRS